MTDIDAGMRHLEPSRADAAWRAREVLLKAAARWAGAPKTHVGAVVLPASRSATLAFDAFFDARRELAHHIGAEVAAAVAAEAVAAEDAGENHR